MKSIITITFIVFMSLTTLHAQWHEVNSPTSRTITDIHIVDSEIGYMSCDLGTILKTTNGGLDWQVFDTGIKASFMSIFGIDKDTVYTARYSLYKSTNSCNSWVDYGERGSSGSISDIHFTSSKTGFITSGALYKTNDYGLNWHEVSKAYPGSKIIFTCKDTGYVVGGAMIKCEFGPCDFPFNRGAIIKTTDGGENWEKLDFFSDTLNILSVSFINNNVGYCFSSNNTIQKTEDGGLTWISMNTGITGNITGGLFINKDIGFITNIGQNSQIYITTNGGIDWDLEYTVTDGGLFEIGSSNKMVVAGGSNGLICIRSLDDLIVNNQNEYSNSKDVLIFPNPAKSYLTIQNKKSQAIQYLLTLRDINGREVLSKKVAFNKVYDLDLNNIKGGIYFLTLTNTENQVVKKIVIQK
jgi:photosystem II stability/assembly factor-like uncharacterized protein